MIRPQGRLGMLDHSILQNIESVNKHYYTFHSAMTLDVSNRGGYVHSYIKFISMTKGMSLIN